MNRVSCTSCRRLYRSADLPRLPPLSPSIPYCATFLPSPSTAAQTKDNETALHCAAQYGHTPVVSLLLEFSCDPTIRNVRGETPLDLAAQYGRLDTVDTLVRTHPALVHAYNTRAPSAIFPSSPLHLASRNGHR